MSWGGPIERTVNKLTYCQIFILLITMAKLIGINDHSVGRAQCA